MKKLSIILLLVVYGLSSTGMTVNFHYCCGKLKKVEFSSVQVACVMKMKHSASKKCCDNKQLDLKVKADQKITEASNSGIAYAAAISPIAPDFSATHPREGRHLIPSVFAPPPLQNQRLYILHCVYLI